jgi:hypothetical protein
MSDFCFGDEINTLCNNAFEYENSMIIKPPNKKESKLAYKYILIDTIDYNVLDGAFTVEFDETIKDIVEIELMSCHMPIPVSTNNTASKTDNYMDYQNNKYLLLFIDNLDLGNYKKISKNQNIKNCFTRLPIQGKTINAFFGRIKNFTNVYQFKPILQKLNKLTIRITDKDGNNVADFSDDKTAYDNAMNILDETTRNINLKICAADKYSIQLTFAITYQTQPDIFD